HVAQPVEESGSMHGWHVRRQRHAKLIDVEGLLGRLRDDDARAGPDVLGQRRRQPIEHRGVEAWPGLVHARAQRRSISCMVFSRLRRIRLNARPRRATSSRPCSANSATRRSPVLTWSAVRAILEIGRTMSRLSMTFRVRKSTTNTATSEPMKAAKARRALRIGRSIGTETIWAPTISFRCQPKPWRGP